MKLIKFIFFILLILLLPIGVFAKIRVVSTIPDFADLAQTVGGKYVQATALVRPTQDPHFVDAKPSFVVQLNRADLLLLTGMGLEAGWLPPLLKGARNAAIQNGADGYIECSAFVTPMNVQAPDRAKGDIHPGGNPHYWISPENGINIAAGITRALCREDSDHCSYFKEQYNGLKKELHTKMAQWRQQLKAAGVRHVVVYHDSWCYFMKWAGLHQVGTLEPKPGVPPNPSHVAGLIRDATNVHVQLVLQESFYPTNMSRLFAQKSGARLKVLPTMVGAAGTRSYIDLIDKIIEEVTK